MGKKLKSTAKCSLLSYSRIVFLVFFFFFKKPEKRDQSIFSLVYDHMQLTKFFLVSQIYILRPGRMFRERFLHPVMCEDCSVKVLTYFQKFSLGLGICQSFPYSQAQAAKEVFCDFFCNMTYPKIVSLKVKTFSPAPCRDIYKLFMDGKCLPSSTQQCCTAMLQLQSVSAKCDQFLDNTPTIILSV